jgi:hypothetical protein
LGGVSLNASLSCSVTQQLGSPQLLFIRRNLHLILYLAKLAKLSYAQLRITLYMLVSFIKKNQLYCYCVVDYTFGLCAQLCTLHARPVRRKFNSDVQCSIANGSYL